jgi:hypothetical protein
VEEADAERWINENLECFVNKDKLDMQRKAEIMAADTMQNTNIIAHSESIIEMQIISLVALNFVIALDDNNVHHMNGSEGILIGLLVMHVFSYVG